MKKRIIGLTGGIATGKTTVSNYLAEVYQLKVLDADVYARDAVKAGTPVLDAIIERYGKSLLLSDGTLNRKQLGEIIFNNATERQWLESQIHPYVRSRFLEAIQKSNLEKTLVLVIPLLFEANMTDLVTESWVVTCPYEQQLQRLIQRNHLTSEQAISRIKSQMPLEEKSKLADVVIHNISDLNALFKQVDVALENPPK